MRVRLLVLLLAATPIAALVVPTTTHSTSTVTRVNHAVTKSLATMAAIMTFTFAPTADAKMPAELSVGKESPEVVAVRQKLFDDSVKATNIGETGTELKIAVKEGALALAKGPAGLPIPTRLPTSVGVTLPVLGSIRADINIAVKGATAAEVAGSDVVIGLPKDLPKAAKLAAGGDASVSIDAPGLLSGRVDLDVVTPRKGEADVAVTSSLIPKLPLAKTSGAGRFCFDCGNGNEPSEWFVARNLKNGVSFYINSKTGESQFQVPKGF